VFVESKGPVVNIQQLLCSTHSASSYRGGVGGGIVRIIQCEPGGVGGGGGASFILGISSMAIENREIKCVCFLQG